MSSVSYRPDIDGLRAIAVLSVILFHAGAPFITGGYVGVDVFFVISGFLITSLIMKDLNAGTFTLSGFWERRFRRILPALAVVVFATLAAGWFLLLPGDYDRLGKQAAVQAVFGSNILFYKEAGYFDSDSFLKPLLHTWSLAVEEQFYLLYPLAVFAVWKKARRFLGAFLVLSAVVSFALCLIVMGHNEELAFFMLPFRGWELLIGGLLAYRTPPLPDKGRTPLAFAGLAAILLPVFLYDKSTVFPGLAALPPTLGTAAIIWAGTGGTTIISSTLSWRSFVFIGLVSYAWYLWHWPVIVFAKYVPGFWNTQIAALCVLGSFILAVFTWKYIETPFRAKKFLPRKAHVYTTAFVTLAVLGGAGWYVHTHFGILERMNMTVAQYARGITDSNPHREQCDKVPVSQIDADKVCETLAGEGVKPSYMLWGDSHADAIAPAFYALSEKYKRNGYVATHHGCPPVIGYRQTDWNTENDCGEFNRAVFDFIARHKIKHVFLVASWMSWIDNKADKTTAALLEQTVRDLKDKGVKVYVLLDLPSAAFDPPRVLALEALFKRKLQREIVPKKAYLENRNAALASLDVVANDAVMIDAADRICPEDTCLIEKDGFSLYYNQGHVSAKGAEYLAPVFEPYFKKGF